MNNHDRIIVESIKSANRISIHVECSDQTQFTLHCNKNKKLYHDIALAYQTAAIAKEREVNQMHKSVPIV